MFKFNQLEWYSVRRKSQNSN